MRRVSLAIGISAALLAACEAHDRLAENQQWMEQQKREAKPSFKPPEPVAEPKAPEAGLALMANPFASDIAVPQSRRP